MPLNSVLIETSFSEIVEYLEREYDNILAEESRIKRNPRFKDNRVHVLLYFITPTGHGYCARLKVLKILGADHTTDFESSTLNL